LVRYLLQHKPKDLKLDYSNAFELQKTYTKQILPFGISGQPGDTVSLFFPQLTSVKEIRMYPGKGATVGSGNNGSNTKVDFVYNSDDPSAQGDTVNVITAQGGVSGDKKYNFSTELYGGRATDFGIGSLQAVTIKSSSFEDLLEDASSDNVKSMINRTKDCVKNGCWGSGLYAGYGGNGGYYYLDRASDDLLAGDFVYMVNNYTERYDGDYLSNNGTDKHSSWGQYKIYKNRISRSNHWYLVTKYIDTKFYKRSGYSGSCNLVDNAKNLTYLPGTCFQHQDSNRANYYYCSLSYFKNSDDVAMVNYLYPELFSIYDTDWGYYALTFQVDPETGNVIKTLCRYNGECSNQSYRRDYLQPDESADVTWNGVGYKKRELASNYFDKNSCSFDRNALTVQCKAKIKINKAKHSCVGNNDDTGKVYKNYDERIKCQNNKCAATNGGNGAVIIVW